MRRLVFVTMKFRTPAALRDDEDSSHHQFGLCCLRSAFPRPDVCPWDTWLGRRKESQDTGVHPIIIPPRSSDGEVRGLLSSMDEEMMYAARGCSEASHFWELTLNIWYFLLCWPPSVNFTWEKNTPCQRSLYSFSVGCPRHCWVT